MKRKIINSFLTRILGYLRNYMGIYSNIYSVNILAKDVVNLVPSSTIEKIPIIKGYELIVLFKDNPDFSVLDLRTPEEFASGHIDGAVNIDFLSFTFGDEIKTLDKNKTYIIHCNSGRRSSRVLNMMCQAGFKSVYDIGGIIEWKENGYPVVK